MVPEGVMEFALLLDVALIVEMLIARYMASG